jgi:hypothetical protein
VDAQIGSCHYIIDFLLSGRALTLKHWALSIDATACRAGPSSGFTWSYRCQTVRGQRSSRLAFQHHQHHGALHLLQRLGVSLHLGRHSVDFIDIVLHGISVVERKHPYQDGRVRNLARMVAGRVDVVGSSRRGRRGSTGSEDAAPTAI